MTYLHAVRCVRVAMPPVFSVRSVRSARTRAAGARGHRQLLAAWLFAAAFAAHALSPDRSLSQLRHDRWTQDDGAPAQIMAIVQTPDGFLWLGSRQGLYRFDGLRFERITSIAGEPLRDDDVLSLRAEPDGSVWVGYFNGSMSRVGGPAPMHYVYERDDVPPGSVIGFARDAAGRLWAATPAAVVHLDAATDTWQPAAPFGFDPAWSPEHVFGDRHGGVWIAYSQGEAFGIAHLAPGAARFDSVAHPVQLPYLAEAPDGTLWATDYWGVRPLAHALPDARHERATATWLDPTFQGAGIAFDRDGAMWLSTGGGIARVRDPRVLRAPGAGVVAPLPEAFGPAQGLTSDVVWTLFEDREGSVWVGTGNGLDRFRDSALVPVRLPRRDQLFSVELGADGMLWTGNADRGPMRIDIDPASAGGVRVEERGDLALQGVTALHRDPAGTLWIGASGGSLWRATDDGLDRVLLPEGIEGAGQVILITSDRDGGLWLSKVNSGLLRLHGGTWTAMNVQYGLPSGMTPHALVEDSAGRMWSDAGQTLRVFEHGERRDLLDDGPGIGRVAALQVDGDSLWAGGLQGVSERRDGRFHRLRGRDGEAFERTAGILVAADGDLWLNGRPGITRVPAAELQRWRADASHAVAFERFGVLDGLRGGAEITGGKPTAVADAQGRLWFATHRGLHWIDPARIARNPAPEPATPVLRAVHVDAVAMPLEAALQLPPRSRDLRIDYTAPALRIAERVRFRHRLDGLDDDWQDAGTRRDVLYSRLAPGTYRFRLLASDDAGRWSPREATLDIVVPPAFWQTPWFALGMLLFALLLVTLLVRWRVAVARARVQRVYRARVGERERIARDLHDTLLQSVQALVLRVQAARTRLARGDSVAAEADLARALDDADASLVEGRDSIRALRGAEAEIDDLESALRHLPQQLDLPDNVAFSIETRGRTHRWRHPELGEVYRLVREAVRNAQHHAGASRIVVRIDYGLLWTSLAIEDDGCGVEEAVLARGGSDGHWGLPGMHERAALCGGHLQLAPLPGGGTRVQVRMPRWRVARTGWPRR